MKYTLVLNSSVVGTFSNVEGVSGELWQQEDQTHALAFSGGEVFESILAPYLGGASIDEIELLIFDSGGSHLGTFEVGPSRCRHFFPEHSDSAGPELVLGCPHLVPAPVHALDAWRLREKLPANTRRHWLGLSVQQRRASLYVNRLSPWPSREFEVLPATVTLDGATTTDYPSLFLALGEAFLGPWGYMGADLDGLKDRLLDHPRPDGGTSVIWRNVGRARLSLTADQWARELWRSGVTSNPETSLFEEVNRVLEAAGLVTSNSPLGAAVFLGPQGS